MTFKTHIAKMEAFMLQANGGARKPPAPVGFKGVANL